MFAIGEIQKFLDGTTGNPIDLPVDTSLRKWVGDIELSEFTFCL
jgi:hypothetical protein